MKGICFFCAAPRAASTSFRLTAEMIENLNALSGVAYWKLGVIFLSLVATTTAPTAVPDEKTLSLQGGMEAGKLP